MQKSLLLLMCFFLSLSLYCQTGFFSIKQSTMDLCFIDTTGNVITIGSTNLTPIGNSTNFHWASGNSILDINPVTRELYFLHDGDSLFSINKQSGNAIFKTKLHVPAGQDTFYAMSFNSYGGLYSFSSVWASSSYQCRLIKNINTTTGETSVAPNTISLPNPIVGIEFDDNNKLWARGINGAYQIDTASGTILNSYIFPFYPSGAPDIDYGNNQMFETNIKLDNRTYFNRINFSSGTSQAMFSLAGGYRGLASYSRTSSDTARIGNVGINTTNPARSLHVVDILRLEPRNTEPENPAKGDIYFDNTINKLRVYDGIQWQNCW